ncbi:outer membrane beta-barrel protein [Corallincola spongiicola]|uniref:Outer membrane protein beta-barrel domain-containing protein n=1 Tax=Corallincola spongiicola TaxID=2520508 RepID=A0ABY1WP57_9GAMM|nr:outer membrane beta-barrel protein [Corallincola spongiicola]TAA45859.1 hypothetical protein EXY25_10915 [Corallincola spongiicola]
MKASAVVLSAFLLACSTSVFAESEGPSFSIGATGVKTYFDESWDLCLYDCGFQPNLDDDTDAGFELFAKVQYSPLWTWKVGYMDQGEFSFKGRNSNEFVTGTGDVSIAYAAWAPQWLVTESFSLTAGLGLGIQNIDLDVQGGEADIDDGSVFYSSLGAEYRFTEQFAMHAEAGYSLGDDIDVGWIGLGGSYFF